jgi:hypothetical protein
MQSSMKLSENDYSVSSHCLSLLDNRLPVRLNKPKPEIVLLDYDYSRYPIMEYLEEKCRVDWMNFNNIGAG